MRNYFIVSSYFFASIYLIILLRQNFMFCFLCLIWTFQCTRGAPARRILGSDNKETWKYGHASNIRGVRKTLSDPCFICIDFHWLQCPLETRANISSLRRYCMSVQFHAYTVTKFVTQYMHTEFRKCSVFSNIFNIFRTSCSYFLAFIIYSRTFSLSAFLGKHWSCFQSFLCDWRNNYFLFSIVWYIWFW